MRLPERVFAERVIAVARGLNAVSAPEMALALSAGGIGTVEVTVECVEGFDAIAAIAGGKLVVGAGTVTTVEHAERAVGAGAEFLVSPHLDPNLLDWATGNDVPLLPGVLSPTEIARALQHGASAVKLFPAGLGGTGYVRSLLGPYPDLELIPTGGIDADNIGAYLDAGAVAVGVGGWLTSHDDMDEVTARAHRLRSQVV